MIKLDIPKTAPAPIIKRVEMLAVFGSGKTTLATRLAKSGASLIAESHELNPFWGNKKAINEIGYMAYDLSFLLQHVSLVTSVKKNGIYICDWSFDTDLLWASLRLGEDFSAYKSMYDALVQKLHRPIGYLYLPQTPETIIQRLKFRSRKNEKSFEKYVELACIQLEILLASKQNENILTVGDDFNSSAFHKWIE